MAVEGKSCPGPGETPSTDSTREVDFADTSDSRSLIRVLAFAVILIIPFRIIGQGYLPQDDVLRHAAKAVSGREWSEILVLRPGIIMDDHPGWHAILRAVHRATGWDARSLVLFSVIGLFAAFSLAPIVLLRRPEAWLIALLVVFLTEPNIGRFLFGRPLILMASLVATLCLLWPRLDHERPPWATLATLAGFIAILTWIHSSWYLQLLPIGCFLLARRWRAAKRLSACVVLGVTLGAVFTGQPIRYLTQAVLHAFLALGSSEPTSTLAFEFRPFTGAPLVVGVVIALLVWRATHGRSNRELLRDPVFIMMVVGWVLGFVVVRFYTDWAIPAFLVFLSWEIQDALDASSVVCGPSRIGVTVAVAIALVLAMTADANSRWSRNTTMKFLALDNPAHAPWLPEPGGILYSTDMSIFFRTFFRNPNAPWRYILGFEPGLMPPEDLEIYRDISSSHGATDSYLQWVRKMKPADRLLLPITSNMPPPVPGLQWHQLEFSIWSGRLPKAPPSHQQVDNPRW